MNKQLLVTYCNHNECNKKLKLIDLNLTCKCGKNHCLFHRYPEKHDCDFDYKYKSKIDEKINKMKCISDKILKF